MLWLGPLNDLSLVIFHIASCWITPLMKEKVASLTPLHVSSDNVVFLCTQ